MSYSETITKADLENVLNEVLPIRADTTIISVTLPFTPPCNGILFGQLRATAQGRAYKHMYNATPDLWDFYQVAGGYAVFASFVEKNKEVSERAVSNLQQQFYYFMSLDGTSPLFGGNADAVIEQGTNTNGTYRKWASGILEQWGHVTIGSNSAAQWTYPVSFYSTDIEMTASCHYLSSGTYVAPTISVQPTQTNYANVYARCSTSTVTSAHKVSCYAIGRWK